MKRSITRGLFACIVAALCLAPQEAAAHIYIASATGHASDTSSPLNGSGDTAAAGGDLLQMILNAQDANASAVVDRRGVFEIDGTTITDHLTERAFLQFDVVGANSPYLVNIFLFAGNGTVSPEDYSRSENLAFSGVLVDDNPFIDVTTQVEQIIDGGNTWIGVLIAMTHEDQTLAIDNVDGRGIDPSITTKGVPEPTTLALLACFPISLALRGRLRRAF